MELEWDFSLITTSNSIFFKYPLQIVRIFKQQVGNSRPEIENSAKPEKYPCYAYFAINLAIADTFHLISFMVLNLDLLNRPTPYHMAYMT